ncbi:hypothetical protein LG634_14470 [Streptomyces bambusae]|uniref:hypothetical protein n=1 Tax=Streptomyces bambusae TaxID=1550616 RepID=UPI001CFC9836|nr:hypothetical protein [Streptomyces bambusae]MCB5166036.1 hypothetical protein [Streptomyces bambusae]
MPTASGAARALTEPAPPARTADLPIVTRPCAYCPKSGADVCVRTHPASEHGAAPHLYAHRACALRVGVSPVYGFADGTTELLHPCRLGEHVYCRPEEVRTCFGDVAIRARRCDCPCHTGCDCHAAWRRFAEAGR